MMPLFQRRLMISSADLKAISSLYNLCLLWWALWQSISMSQTTKSIRLFALGRQRNHQVRMKSLMLSLKKIRLWAFASSGGYLQLVIRTRLFPNATEASHCVPSSRAPTSKVRWKGLETYLTDLSDSQFLSNLWLPVCLTNWTKNLLCQDARQLGLLSSLCTLFWKHWTLVADALKFSSQTSVKASTLWTTMYC